MERLVRYNALNRTGSLNYNKYGAKDGIGFTSCSDKFVDNFILQILVPEQKLHKKKYVHVGAMNKIIRELLTRQKLTKCRVKAIGLKPFCRQPDKLSNRLDQLLHNDKKDDQVEYFLQEYKIACADERYENVLAFVRAAEYKNEGLTLKDIDVTMDYAGSFDKEEVSTYLTGHRGFRQADSHDVADRTIVDNDHYVGRNCLTYMETVQGITTRCKIYNKMVQMLECKGVRESIGQHWKDWVSQEDTRLAKARDAASSRGLTRAEVTFFCQDGIPDDEFMEETLLSVTSYVDDDLVYSTPYHLTWKVYCESFQHSLVAIHRQADLALLVLSYNEVTHDVSGHLISKWSEKEKWSLFNLTLNGALPIDVVEVNDSCYTYTSSRGRNKILEVKGMRYFKSTEDGSSNFNTRLVANNGVYGRKEGNPEDNASLLVKAGLVEHENCIPYMASKTSNKRSKPKGTLHRADMIEVHLPSEESSESAKDTKRHLVRQICGEEATRLGEVRKQIESDMREKKEKLKELDKYSKVFSANKVVPLKALEKGTYNVMSIREVQTKFGRKYTLIVDLDGSENFVLCYSNKYLEETIDALFPIEKRLQYRDDRGNLTLFKQPIAQLRITGWGWTPQRNVIVYCQIFLATEKQREERCLPTLQSRIERDIDSDISKIEKPESAEKQPLPQICKEDIEAYKHLSNLIELPIGSAHEITAFGFQSHYGRDKLVVKLSDGRLYQAGEGLEGQHETFFVGTKIVVEKHRVCKTSRRKYAVCQIVQKDDWSGLVDYNEAELLPPRHKRQKVSVLDVKSVPQRGQERKLILVEGGVVYKIKKSKLEETVKPGQEI